MRRIQAEQIVPEVNQHENACGGGAIAVWAAERLPMGSKVDGVILLAPALSPKYSLQTALAHSRLGVVNFHSRGDWMILGVGTSLAGTMDGDHSESAGMVGFAVPPGLAADVDYRRVHQIAWRPGMAGTGNIGGHLSSSAARFVAGYVAPLVLSPRWDSRFVGRVGEGVFVSHSGEVLGESGLGRDLLAGRTAQIAPGNLGSK